MMIYCPHTMQFAQLHYEGFFHLNHIDVEGIVSRGLNGRKVVRRPNDRPHDHAQRERVQSIFVYNNAVALFVKVQQREKDPKVAAATDACGKVDAYLLCVADDGNKAGVRLLVAKGVAHVDYFDHGKHVRKRLLVVYL